MDNRNRNGDSGETSNHKKKYHFDALRKLENNNNITDTNHQSILVFDFHSLDTKTDKKIEYVSKQWEAYKKFFSDVPGRLTQDISIGPAIEQIKQVWNTEKINNEKDQSEQQKIILKTMEEINNRIVTSLNPNLKSLKPNEVKNIEGSIRKLNRNLYNIDYEQYHKPQLIELQNVLKEHVDQVMSIKVEEGIKRLNDSLSRDNENTTLKEQYNLYKGHKKQLNNFISGIASMQEEYMKSKDLDHMNPLRTNLANVGTDSSYVNDFKKRLDTHINDRENLHQQHLHQLDQDILNLTELHKVLTDAGVSGDCTNNLNMNIQNLRKTANDYNTANQLEKGSVILNNYKTLLDTTKKEAFKNLDEHLNTLYHENGHKIFEICNKLRNVSLNPFEETNELIRNLKLEVQGYSKKDFPDLVDMSQSTENGNIKYRVFNSSYIKGYEMDDRKMLLELRLNRGLDVANMYHRFLMSLDMQYNNQMSKDVMDRIQAFKQPHSIRIYII